MSPHAFRNFLIFLTVLMLIDLYAWKGISTALGGSSVMIKRWTRILYWVVSLGIIGVMVWVGFSIQELRQSRNYSFLFSLAALFMLFFLPKLVLVVFHLIEDVLSFLRWVWCTLAPGSDRQAEGTARPSAEGLWHALGANGISRLRFLSQLGLALASIPFGGVLYGITHGRRNFRVARVKVDAPGLPEAFDGLRIVQISDMHLGSFSADTDIVRKGVDLINAEDPDLILFTGDLVNDFNEEALPWLDTLKELRARMGKYSILGNHDYSDYAPWPDPAQKRENLKALIGHHATMGFRILLDEHLPLEKDGQRIGLLGVQNWGSRFQQYGDLKKTMQGSEEYPYRILMSHDPSHWEAQVWGTGIDLTLSGHTHGAQFGITIAGQTYSPAQWVYKHWAGLYENAGQHLYVNRGFGYIGFPGRVGMPPEITVLELRRV